jgi:tight adherence protein B
VAALIACGFALAIAFAAVAAFDAARRAARRYGASVSHVAQEGLADLFVFVDAKRLITASVVAAVAVAACAWLLGSPAALAIGAGSVVLVLPRAAHRWMRARRLRRLAHQLPDALDSLSGALRAGLSLQQALATLAEQQPRPVALEFALVLRKQRLGMALDQGLAELATRVPRHEFVLFVTSVRVARDLGGNLAETLERLAGTLRRKLAMEDKIDALTAQGRLQGWIVGLLPVFLALVLGWLEPETMRLLYTTPIGWSVLAVLGLLLGAGALLIRKIVRIDV